MASTSNNQPPIGEWVHAHEEDSPGEQVFRPASTPLPPSRGRQRLNIKADGTVVFGGPGADDRTVQASGRWETRPSGQVVLIPRAGSSGQQDRLFVTEVAHDRMVVKRAP
jgi:hypothetical protein